MHFTHYHCTHSLLPRWGILSSFPLLLYLTSFCLPIAFCLPHTLPAHILSLPPHHCHLTVVCPFACLPICVLCICMCTVVIAFVYLSHAACKTPSFFCMCTRTHTHARICQHLCIEVGHCLAFKAHTHYTTHTHPAHMHTPPNSSTGRKENSGGTGRDGSGTGSLSLDLSIPSYNVCMEIILHSQTLPNTCLSSLFGRQWRRQEHNCSIAMTFKL